MRIDRINGKLALVVSDDFSDEERRQLMVAYSMGLIFLITEIEKLHQRRAEEKK